MELKLSKAARSGIVKLNPDDSSDKKLLVDLRGHDILSGFRLVRRKFVRK